MIFRTIIDAVGIGPVRRLWIWWRGRRPPDLTPVGLPRGVSLGVAGTLVSLVVPTAAGLVVVSMADDQALAMAWGFWEAAGEARRARQALERKCESAAGT